MKTIVLIAAPEPGFARPRGSAFTLLEVLVSLGVIAGALAGIAALLPAAGAKLAEATAADRAAAMAANARADMANRGMTQWPMWQLATGTSSSTRAVVCGEGLTIDGTAVAMTSATNTIAYAGAGVLATRIDPSSGFWLRDQLQMGGGLVTGFLPGVCYGAMLSSTAAPTGPGSSVRQTIAVFRKPGAAVQGVALTAMSGSTAFQVTGTLGPTGAAVPMSDTDAATVRKQFLPGCSWILVVSPPGQSPREPRWVPIASSWTNWALVPSATGSTYAPTGPSFVTLSGTEHHDFIVSGTLQAFGFDGLLRVDERFVTLE